MGTLICIRPSACAPAADVTNHPIRRPIKKTLKNTTRVSMPAHGRCEAVAAERAGGERCFLFAGQKENRVHPSNKAASEVLAATLRRVLNAGRRNSKDRLQTRLHRCGSGKRGPGKSEGLFPEWGAQRTRGAGRGGTAPKSPASKPLTTVCRLSPTTSPRASKKLRPGKPDGVFSDTNVPKRYFARGSTISGI